MNEELAKELDEADFAAWVEGVEAEVEKSAADLEREAVAALRRVNELRRAIRSLQKELEKLEAPIRRWYQVNPDEALLLDGEHNLQAYMRPVYSTAYEKASAIRSRDEALYRRLEELGCLAVDGKAVEAALRAGWLTSSDIDPYRQRLQVASRLEVKQVD